MTQYVPRVTTIPPDDSWWDDPAPPLARHGIVAELLDGYDAYVTCPRVSSTESAIVYERADIQYAIIGCYEPIFIKLINHDDVTYNIDCRYMSRGSLVRGWGASITSCNPKSTADVFMLQLFEELQQRNDVLHTDDNFAAFASYFDKWRLQSIVREYENI